MKGYVVTLMDLPKSVEVAQRCIDSAKKVNVSVEMFPAVYKDVALQEAEEDGIKLSKWDRQYSNYEAVVGNIVSQHRIWSKIAAGTQPRLVLEHDAVFVKELPKLAGKGDIINLGKPSFSVILTQPGTGVFTPKTRYLHGAHGYYLTPKGAQQLIDKAQEVGAAPCDIFLHLDNFPNLKEYYPWPIIADDSFTTIQKERGCVTKHNYKKDKDGYELL